MGFDEDEAAPGYLKKTFKELEKHVFRIQLNHLNQSQKLEIVHLQRKSNTEYTLTLNTHYHDVSHQDVDAFPASCGICRHATSG